MKVIDLRHGQQIAFYGKRTVIDVQNVHESYGKNMVRLCTNDGTFIIDKFAYIALTEESLP